MRSLTWQGKGEKPMAVRQIVNLLRGSVELEVQGAFPERFLNLCAQRGVAFWGVEWPDSHTLRLTVAWPDRAGLEELGEPCVPLPGAVGGDCPPSCWVFATGMPFWPGCVWPCW